LDEQVQVVGHEAVRNEFKTSLIAGTRQMLREIVDDRGIRERLILVGCAKRQGTAPRTAIVEVR
jgi:hypothetical protein